MRAEMPEKVEIEVSVKTIGTESLKQTQTELTKLGKTIDSGQVSQKKLNTESELFKTSLTKQLPLLKDLNPVWGALGISWLMGASALGVVGVGMVQVAQTALGMASGVANLTTSINEQTTGPLTDWGEQNAKVTALSKEWYVSIGDITKAYDAMNPKITDLAVREDILNQALQLHKETGISVEEAVRKLSNSLTDDLIVRDKVTGEILRGNDALLQERINIESSSNAWAGAASAIGDIFKMEWQKTVNFFTTVLPRDIGEALNFVIGEAKKTWDAGWKIGEWLVSIGQTAYNSIVGPVKQFFMDGWNNITSWIGEKLKGIADFFLGLWDAATGKGASSTLSSSSTPSGGVTGYAEGTDYVPATGLYQLHKGEAVIPAAQNTGGATTINLYLSDGTQLASWVMDKIETAARLRGAF